MMNNYEIRVIPKEDATGKIYWTAFYPAIEGCVGGGDTVAEAISEAEENLECFLLYLKEEKLEVPKPYAEVQYSGKIALRLPKRTHRLVALQAKEEEVSINTFLVSAIEHYLGKKEYEYKLNSIVEEFRDMAHSSLQMQEANLRINEFWLNGCAAAYNKGLGIRDNGLMIGGYDE